MLGLIFAGFLFGLSLIVTIGPQNTFVIRQGAVRQHVPSVVAICSASDALLIGAGVAGAGAALSGRAWLLSAVRITGAVVLLTYASLAARRATQPPADPVAAAPTRTSRRTAIGACLAFTWLNPAVYLDTVVLLGSVAGTTGGRWWFAAGAAAASLLWFALLGFGARLLTPLLARPTASRALDALIAAIMTVTAVRLALGS